jgi:hypothetical protein
MFGALLALFVAGCGSNPDAIGPDTAEREILFGGSAADDPREADTWSIALAAFAGDGAHAQAAAQLADIRGSDETLGTAFIAERSGRAVVMVGRYASPSTAEALRALNQIRAIARGDQRPFANAFFVPPPGGAPDDLDLRSVRSSAADPVFTLQVGAYGRIDAKPLTEKELAEVRATAERAARDLRSQGEHAFFFHGPSLSMVTVGVFKQSDLNANPAALEPFRERFPHNLLNGEGIREKVRTADGERWRLQPSQLVAVP